MKSAEVCGLVFPDVRSDAYTELMHVMNTMLPESNQITMSKNGGSGITRQSLKDAFMPFFYLSTREPKNIFGEDTIELDAFLAAIHKMCPGACSLKDDIAGAMRASKLSYKWTLPDGFEVNTDVEIAREVKVELQELKNESGNSATFTHTYYEKGKNPAYMALAANVTHSWDAYVVREIKRRAAIDRKHKLPKLIRTLQAEGIEPNLYATDGCISIKIAESMEELCNPVKSKLLAILMLIAEYPVAFDILTVHDAFTASPVHMNEVRRMYLEILAEIAESNVIEDVLTEIYEEEIEYEPEGDRFKLAAAIRNSNYALS